MLRQFWADENGGIVSAGRRSHRHHPRHRTRRPDSQRSPARHRVGTQRRRRGDRRAQPVLLLQRLPAPQKKGHHGGFCGAYISGSSFMDHADDCDPQRGARSPVPARPTKPRSGKLKFLPKLSPQDAACELIPPGGVFCLAVVRFSVVSFPCRQRSRRSFPTPFNFHRRMAEKRRLPT